MNNQQGPTVEQRELCSMLSGGLNGRQVWGRMYTCTCKAESLHCSPETIKILLISYTLIENKKFKLKKIYIFLKNHGFTNPQAEENTVKIYQNHSWL